MGVAAYNRGSQLVARQIAAEARPAEFEIMDRLNSLPKNAGAQAPWGPVRIAEGNGVWWVYCPVTTSGYWYRTLHALVRAWDITVIGYDNGEWLAVPTPPPSDVEIECPYMRALYEVTDLPF